MKISKTKLHQIIKEELQRLLAEGSSDLPTGAGATIYGPRAGASLAGQRSDGKTAQDLDKTQEIDMDPHLNSADPWLAAETFRPESKRLFNHFFGNYDDDAMELLLHEDPNLSEIIRHLYGWDLNIFPKMREPNPPYVEVAQDFEKEGKHILDNEDEFLDRLEPAMDRWGKARFAAQMKHKRPGLGTSADEHDADDAVRQTYNLPNGWQDDPDIEPRKMRFYMDQYEKLLSKLRSGEFDR